MIKQGNCFELLKKIPDASVDAIITDPPYGCINQAWDIMPPTEEMFREFVRVLKPLGVMCIFADFRYAMELYKSRPKLFRYEIVMHKSKAVGFFDANWRPLRAHEYVLIFADGIKSATYNPQKTPGKPYEARKASIVPNRIYSTRNHQARGNPTGERFPRSVVNTTGVTGGAHPTQKPLEFIEMLVKTYTNPGETVLDPFLGSGTTGVACVHTGRKFIGFELDKEYFQIASRRIAEAEKSVTI